MSPTSPHRRLALCTPWLLAATLALSSHAALAAGLSGSVTVNLIAPGGLTIDGGGPATDTTPINLSDTVTVSPGSIEVSAGDGTLIGGMLLTSPTPIVSSIPLYASVSSELIDFNGSSIFVRLLSGSIDENTNVSTTGYLGLGGSHARYEFTNLNVPGELITGLSYLVGDNFGTSANTGLTNLGSLPASFIRLTSAHSIAIDLDGLQFADRGQGSGGNYAEFRIDLQTSPVPEADASLMALFGLGLGGLFIARRKTTPHRA
jgi:hypothetical protein